LEVCAFFIIFSSPHFQITQLILHYQKVLFGLSVFWVFLSTQALATNVMRNEEISFQADERLFTLYTAFNTCGYDLENLKMEKPFPTYLMSETRLEVRNALKQKTSAFYSFCRFIEKHQKPWFYYTAYVLALSNPPEFKLDTAVYKGVAEAEVYTALENLDKEIAAFYRKAAIHSLWKKHLPAYQKEIDYYRKHTKMWLKKVSDMFGQNSSSERLVILPNLLEAHYQADIKPVGKLKYILLPPRCDDYTGESTIIHEYLHILVRSVLKESMTNTPAIQRIYRETKLKTANFSIRENYSTAHLWVDETFVRVLTYKITGIPNKIPEKKWLNNLVVMGFPLAPDIARGIDEYLREGTLLADIVLKILKDIKPEIVLRNYNNVLQKYKEYLKGRVFPKNN